MTTPVELTAEEIADAMRRIEAYLDEYAKMGGVDREAVHTLQAGSVREQRLLVADIKALLCRNLTGLGGDGVATLVKALRTIEAWDLPPTGKIWSDVLGAARDETPMSYEACYGSNGARDYMRDIARKALASLTVPVPGLGSDADRNLDCAAARQHAPDGETGQ